MKSQHQREKDELLKNEQKLRDRLKELNAELDKAQGFDETGNSSVAELQSQNEFLQRQAEEFADELERTLNQEDEISKENTELQEKVVSLQVRVELFAVFES